MAPVFSSCLPLFAKSFLIDIAVLADDAENPRRFRLCQPEADRGSIVKHIKKELPKPHHIGKLPDDIGEDGQMRLNEAGEVVDPMGDTEAPAQTDAGEPADV